MADNITSPEDVASGFTGDASDQNLVNPLIARAERKLAARLGNLTIWAGSNPDRIAAIKDVVSEMVQRVLRSGGSAFKSESDDGYSYTIDPVAASASLWVTDSNWEQLVGPQTGVGFGSARLTVPQWSGRGTW